MIRNNRCEKCNRNMGDIDQPICHECEQHEIDRQAELDDANLCEDARDTA